MSIYSANNMLFVPSLRCFLAILFVHVVIIQISCSVFQGEQFYVSQRIVSKMFSSAIQSLLRSCFLDVYKASKNLFAMSPIDNQSSQ